MSRPRGSTQGMLWAAVLTLSVLPMATTAHENAESALPPDLPIHFGGSFELVDHHGGRVSDEDFAGRFMLIYFGYTHCPNICPTNLSTMAQALQQLGNRAEPVQPLFISVDPGRDTVDVLAKYVGLFHPDLIGLTGTQEQVRAAARAYKIHRSKIITENQESENDYLVNHSSITYLMGPTGEFVTLFPHDTKAEFMATTITKYLNASTGSP